MTTSMLLVGASLGAIASLGTYILISTRYALASRGKDTYFFYDHSLSATDIQRTIFASGMSLASVFIAILQLGAIFGIALSWATITYVLGWFFIFSLSKRIRTRALPLDTLHSFLGRTYGSRIFTIIASCATIAGFIGTFATEILAAKIILTALSASAAFYIAALFIFAGVTIAYSAIGGFAGVIHSDAIQSRLILPAALGILILALWARQDFHGTGIVDAALLTKFTLPIGLIISLVLINIAFPIVDMSAWQRILAASSVTAIRRGGRNAIILFIISWTMILFAAMALSQIVPLDKDPFSFLIGYVDSRFGQIAFVLGIFLSIGLTAALLSADTHLNAAAHTFSLDILVQRHKSGIATGQNQASVRAARISVVVLGFLGFLICFVLQEIGFGIIDLVFSAYGATLSLLPSTVAALFSDARRSIVSLRYWAISSAICGFVVGWSNGIYGVSCKNSAFALCGDLGTLLTPDVYSTPLYVALTSTVIFVVGASWQGLRNSFSSRN